MSFIKCNISIFTIGVKLDCVVFAIAELNDAEDEENEETNKYT